MVIMVFVYTSLEVLRCDEVIDGVHRRKSDEFIYLKARE
jgi:hypothetical protein